MEEKNEGGGEKKPFNHVLEVQNGFIDVTKIFRVKFEKKTEVKDNGKVSS
jgi:hypothetical protein